MAGAVQSWCLRFRGSEGMRGGLEANVERRRTSWHGGGGCGPCTDLHLHLPGMERDREENLC